MRVLTCIEQTDRLDGRGDRLSRIIVGDFPTSTVDGAARQKVTVEGDGLNNARHQ